MCVSLFLFFCFFFSFLLLFCYWVFTAACEVSLVTVMEATL